jgi:hypothetical protein
MKALRDVLAHWTMGLVGIVSGALSMIGLAVAAFAAAVLGLLALALAPLRVIADRIRGS